LGYRFSDFDAGRFVLRCAGQGRGCAILGVARNPVWNSARNSVFESIVRSIDKSIYYSIDFSQGLVH
jgi:hypothetical protein